MKSESLSTTLVLWIEIRYDMTLIPTRPLKSPWITSDNCKMTNVYFEQSALMAQCCSVMVHYGRSIHQKLNILRWTSSNKLFRRLIGAIREDKSLILVNYLTVTTQDSLTLQITKHVVESATRHAIKRSDVLRWGQNSMYRSILEVLETRPDWGISQMCPF